MPRCTKKSSLLAALFGAPAGTRTPDTLLKRQVLYLLSYWGVSSEQASDRLAYAKRGESSLPSLLLLSKSDPLRWALILFYGNGLPRLPKSKPEFRFGKEEGTYGCAAFAALTQTAEAERSKFLLTPWLGWRDSNPLYRSQSPVCYHYTTSQCSHKPRPAPPASARFQWGGIWGSNPRHPEPQSGALPTELIPPYLSVRPAARPIKNSKPKP